MTEAVLEYCTSPLHQRGMDFAATASLHHFMKRQQQLLQGGEVEGGLGGEGEGGEGQEVHQTGNHLGIKVTKLQQNITEHLDFAEHAQWWLFSLLLKCQELTKLLVPGSLTFTGARIHRDQIQQWTYVYYIPG